MERGSPLGGRDKEKATLAWACNPIEMQGWLLSGRQLLMKRRRVAGGSGQRERAGESDADAYQEKRKKSDAIKERTVQ